MLRRSRLLVAATVACAFVACSSLVAALRVPHAATPNSVTINGYTMTVDGKPFKVKGIAYSPVPVGESVHFPPYGDYFTADYVYMWSRDFPAMKAMGINTLRIYAWSFDVDHSAFLDAADDAGLKVIMTHYIGTAAENDISTPAKRDAITANFVRQVAITGDHPALLAWSFGNEINGPWNGFLPSLETEFQCGYTMGLVQTGACSENVDVNNTVCHQAQLCMYTHFYGWLDSALAAAKSVTTRPLTSTFADVGMLVGTTPLADKLSRFSYLLPHFDMISIQLYRGQSFQDYFLQYQSETSKPLLVAEYGVDAMNDPCGWGENEGMQPCSNYESGLVAGSAGGSAVTPWFQGCSWNQDRCNKPGETLQSQWNLALTQEIQSAAATLGGVMMEWHDEYWKNINTQDSCVNPCNSNDLAQCSDPHNPLHANFAMDTGSARCTYKAHISCSNYNTSYHDMCGYWLWSAPDQYVNEAWFGVSGISDCAGKKNWNDESHHMSVLQPRSIVAGLRAAFNGPADMPAMSTSCDLLTPCWQCSQTHGLVGVQQGWCNIDCAMKFADPVPPPAPSSSSSSSSSAAATAAPSSTANMEESTGVYESCSAGATASSSAAPVSSSAAAGTSPASASSTAAATTPPAAQASSSTPSPSSPSSSAAPTTPPASTSTAAADSSAPAAAESSAPATTTPAPAASSTAANAATGATPSAPASTGQSVIVSGDNTAGNTTVPSAGAPAATGLASVLLLGALMAVGPARM